MKNIKNYFIILILLGALIVPTFTYASWWNPFSWDIWQDILNWQFSKNVLKSKSSLTTITDDNFGVSIAVPKNWKKLQYSSEEQKKNQIGFIYNFQKFEIWRQDMLIDFDEYVKYNDSQQKNVVKSEDIIIDGKSAHKIIRDQDSTVSPKAITIFINGGDYFYHLDWVMDEDYLNNNQSEIDGVLNSMHFTK